MAHLRQFRLTPSVPLEAVPEAFRGRIGPESPLPARKVAARAMLPADPGDTVAILAYLAADSDPGVGPEAVQSLTKMPENILRNALRGALPPSVLAACASYLLRVPHAIEAVAQNPKTPDEALAYIAANGEGTVLDHIAINQVRLLKSADVVEALYFNPKTSTASAARAIETGVRGNMDLGHIPGFREIAASILGEKEAREYLSASYTEPAEEVAEPIPAELAAELPEGLAAAPQPDDADVDVAAILAAGPAAFGAVDGAFSALVGLADGQEMSEELFDQLLRIASASDEADEQWGTEVEAKSSNALWAIIREMNVPQKVRLALMGSETARAILIRDAKRVVAMSVLKSPRLSDREIAGYARNKTLSEDVVRFIANTREWTKAYPVRMGLVTNPKCPPGKATNFLSTLTERDLKGLSKDREVPGHISKLAKQIMAHREKLRGH